MSGAGFVSRQLAVLRAAMDPLSRFFAAALVLTSWSLHPIDSALAILCLPILLLANPIFCLVLFFLLLTCALASFHSTPFVAAIVAGLALPFWLSGKLLANEGPAKRCIDKHDHILRPLLTALIVFSMCTLLHRNVTWWLPVSYSLVFFLIRRSLPARKRRTMVEWLPNLVLLFCATLVSIGLGELLAHQVSAGRPWERTDFYEYHPQAAFTLRPNAVAPHYRFAGEGQWVEIPTRISSQGLRDREYGPRKADEFRVFILGDSFTMGWGLPAECGYVDKLERLLQETHLPVKVSILNGGCGSYGPWQELYFLRERGFPREPCLVLHQLFVSNDIDNTLTQVGRYPQAYNRNGQLDFLRWQNRGAWPVRFEEWLKDRSAIYRTLLRANGSSDLIVEGLWRLRFAPAVPRIRLARSASRPFNLEVCLRKWYPVLAEGWAMFEADVLAVKRACDARGIAYAAFCIPDRCDVADEHWLWATKKLGENAYERYKDVRLAEDLFDLERIEYPPMRPVFENAPNRNELYFPDDGHLTDAGTTLVAEELKRFIIEHYFSGGRLPACVK